MSTNEIIKYISIVLSVAVIGSVSSAMSVDGKLFTDPIGDYTYSSVLDYKEEVVYEQTEASIRLVQEVDSKKTIRSLDNVPGKNANGYSKLIIKKLDENNVTIEASRQEYFGNETAELKYIVKGAFLKGSWADLVSGKAISIAVAQDSQALFRNKVKDYLGNVIKCMANAGFGAKLIGGFQMIKIPDDKFRLDAYTLVGTKKELNQKFEFDATFKLMQAKDALAAASN